MSRASYEERRLSVTITKKRFEKKRGNKSDGIVTAELNWERWCDVVKPAVRWKAVLLCVATWQGGIEETKQ